VLWKDQSDMVVCYLWSGISSRGGGGFDPVGGAVYYVACGRPFAGIAGSNLVEGRCFHLLCLLCVVQLAVCETS